MVSGGSVEKPSSTTNLKIWLSNDWKEVSEGNKSKTDTEIGSLGLSTQSFKLINTSLLY